MAKRALTLDFDIADQITVLSLKDARKLLKEQLKEHKNGKYLHPEDVGENYIILDAITKVLNYYGHK